LVEHRELLRRRSGIFGVFKQGNGLFWPIDRFGPVARLEDFAAL
jgi:hypothetical protein